MIPLLKPKQKVSFNPTITLSSSGDLPMDLVEWPKSVESMQRLSETFAMKKSGPKLMLLGAGELGKELTISAQRMGLHVVAVDRYADAPAMQVADECEVIDMLNSSDLARVVSKHRPQILIPEIEAIRTEKLKEFEAKGLQVVPTARAVDLTMNRDAIRDVAHRELKLKTARFEYAESAEELAAASLEIGFPNVVKPVMSSSGKGQSVVRSKSEVAKAWKFAVAGMRGDKQKVIVEEFIAFESEITLLTVKQKTGPTLFVKPIGHRQERGDYQESWLPARISPSQLKKAQLMAKKVTDYLGGAGLFGVEFFLTKNDVYFSELSPRPHDTGMVTLSSQDLSEFDLHLRAILGFPIPEISYWGPAASAVILAKAEGSKFEITGLKEALKIKNSDVRIFGKPSAHVHRRMGVALARGKSVVEARRKARQVADKVKVKIKSV
jgi:phosphoribosylglycinamide formyltransferase 2